MRIIIPLLCILIFASTYASPGEDNGGKKKRPRNEERPPRRNRPNKRPGSGNDPSATTTTTTESSTTTTEPTPRPNRPVKPVRFHDNMNRNGPMPDPPKKSRRRPTSGGGTGQRGIGSVKVATSGAQGIPQTKQVNTNSLSSEMKQVFLNAHNDFRSQVNSPTAANMVQMEWDDSLAEMAQGWSDQCTFGHGNPPNISPYSWVGQNIWAGSGTGWDHYGMIEDWYNEVSDYNYQTNSCTGICGHYTQVVWAESTHVGCAITTCTTVQNLGWSPATILVCNYGEGGNYVGQKPYVSGPPCSQCPSSHPICVNGKLCAAEGSNANPGSGNGGGNNGGNNGGGNTGSGGNTGGNDGGNNGGNDNDNIECGGTLTDNQGSFTSPGWSAPYPLNSHCEWMIQGNQGDQITLTLTYMDIEVGPTCSWDYLQIQTSPSDPGIKYCGMQTPPQITSDSGMMLITFHSDYTVPRGGFTTNYKIIENKQDECGGILQGGKGWLTSPDWPSPYGPQQDCLWTIRVPQNKRVQIWFTAFNLADHETCSYDHVTLKLGDEKVPMRLCGSDVSTGKYTSIGHEVQLRFRSTHGPGKIGFRAQFKAVR
ncbi:cubilin-like [Lytechinus variegatus]|uniref:cubilin-like n=1 Tax=Lytechinus variegatus TaxID=7654 RepID=UPI001BB26E15|nr:cubilin-like [Lytechinus variegatus]